MTPREAREIADEHIAWLRRGHDGRRRMAVGLWEAISPDRYPGGGWERVRALMVGWLIFDAASGWRE